MSEVSTTPVSIDKPLRMRVISRMRAITPPQQYALLLITAALLSLYGLLMRYENEKHWEEARHRCERAKERLSEDRIDQYGKPIPRSSHERGLIYWGCNLHYYDEDMIYRDSIHNANTDHEIFPHESQYELTTAADSAVKTTDHIFDASKAVAMFAVFLLLIRILWRFSLARARELGAAFRGK